MKGRFMIMIALLSMCFTAQAQESEAVITSVTCYAILAAIDDPDSVFWYGVVVRTVGATKAASLFDKYATIITANIEDGSVSEAQVLQALSECRQARARAR